MNASKENCTRAVNMVSNMTPEHRIDEERLGFLREFLAAAQRKLPSEASFAKASAQQQERRQGKKNVTA